MVHIIQLVCALKVIKETCATVVLMDTLDRVRMNVLNVSIIRVTGYLLPHSL